MKKFLVTGSITQYFTIEVECEDAEDAREIALDSGDWDPVETDNSEDIEYVSTEEIE